MSSTIVNELISRGLIPVLTHDNETYEFCASEALKATKGILGQPLPFFVVRSTKANAYAIKISAEVHAIAVSDALLETLESAATTLLSDERIRQWLVYNCRLEYTPRTPEQRLTTGLSPARTRQSAGQDVWLGLFYRIFDYAFIFILLHEIAHIHNNDSDPATPAVGKEFEVDLWNKVGETGNFITHGGDGPNRFSRYAEYKADRAATLWFLQVVPQKVRRLYGDQPHPASVWIEFIMGFFGLIVAIIYLRDETSEAAADQISHLLYEARFEAVQEGLDLALPDIALLLDRDERQGQLRSYQLRHAMFELRKAIEIVIFGKPSKFIISF